MVTADAKTRHNKGLIQSTKKDRFWFWGNKGNHWTPVPLSKLYCRDRISPQCLPHSMDSFLGLSSRFTARASTWLLYSSSDIFLMDSYKHRYEIVYQGTWPTSYSNDSTPTPPLDSYWDNHSDCPYPCQRYIVTTISSMYVWRHLLLLKSQPEIYWFPKQSDLFKLRLTHVWYWVPKWWRHKNDFSEIMGSIRLFRTTYLKTVHTQNTGSLVH